MPGWLQAFVKVNPMTLLTDAERGLFTGGPVATPAVQSMLWALGIFVVFAPAGRPRLPAQDLARRDGVGDRAGREGERVVTRQ